MTEQAGVFDRQGPQREWLTRCTDAGRRPAVCAVAANDGEIEIAGPADDAFVLEGAAIGDFRDGLEAAIRQAETDLRARSNPDPRGD